MDSKYKILGIFANHTTTKIKYEVTLSNISLLKDNLTDIVIIDSTNEIYSKKLYDFFKDKIQYHFLIKNDNYYDFGKWIYGLNMLGKSFYSKYDYILFINDSIIITDPLNNYFKYLNNVKSNLYAYNDSTQIKYHYQSYLFSVKSSIIPKFIKFFEDRRKDIINLESLIYNIELNMCDIDEYHDCFIKIGGEWNKNKNIFWENEVLYEYLMTNDIFSIIKLKKIFDIQSEYKIKKYTKNDIIDFDYNFYRYIHTDLKKIKNNSRLINHFIEHGQYEGRQYNKIFDVVLPKYYRDKLEGIKLLYLFDVKYDFNIYFYKMYNKDIKDVSLKDALFHYIIYGFEEGRKYI